MAIIPQQDIVLPTGGCVTIRTAHPDDAVDLVAHGRAIVAEGRFLLMEPDEFTITIGEEEELIRQHAADPGRLLLLAEISGRLAGALFFKSQVLRRMAHVGSVQMSVGEEYRSLGIGSALLGTLLDWARQQPAIEKVSLGVLASNTIAIALYRKLGFVEEGRLPREIKLGPDDYVDELMMHRFVDGRPTETES